MGVPRRPGEGDAVDGAELHVRRAAGRRVSLRRRAGHVGGRRVRRARPGTHGSSSRGAGSRERRGRAPRRAPGWLDDRDRARARGRRARRCASRTATSTQRGGRRRTRTGWDHYLAAARRGGGRRRSGARPLARRADGTDSLDTRRNRAPRPIASVEGSGSGRPAGRQAGDPSAASWTGADRARRGRHHRAGGRRDRQRRELVAPRRRRRRRRDPPEGRAGDPGRVPRAAGDALSRRAARRRRGVDDRGRPARALGDPHRRPGVRRRRATRARRCGRATRGRSRSRTSSTRRRSPSR